MAGEKPVAEFPASRRSKVVVWNNRDGYSIQVVPPSWKEGDEWKTAKGFWTCDLPGLIHALARAQAWLDQQTIPPAISEDRP